MFKFLTGIGVGCLISNPEVITSLILKIREKQAEAKRELVENSRIIEKDLQNFLLDDAALKKKRQQGK